MNDGTVFLIVESKNLFCLNHGDETYSIGQYYDTSDISLQDIISTTGLMGDILVENLTKKKMIQVKIRFKGTGEKKMKKFLESFHL